jgi:hypothetical protein
MPATWRGGRVCMKGNPWFPFIKRRPGLHRTPALLRTNLRKRLKKLLLLLLGGLLLGCRLLGGLLLCHHFYLLRLVIRTRGSMVWRAGFPSETSWTISSARTSCEPHGFSPRSLFDEVSETLAVVRNVALTRVGSVASVGATTSSIAIQSVLIQRLHRSSQEIAKIFFRAMPGEMLRVRDFHDVSRPLTRSSAHRMRAM